MRNGSRWPRWDAGGLCRLGLKGVDKGQGEPGGGGWGGRGEGAHKKGLVVEARAGDVDDAQIGHHDVGVQHLATVQLYE